MRDKTNNLVWLTDIVESIDLIESYIANVTEEEFFNSEEKQDAIVRRLGIIGEAVKNITEDYKNAHSEVPWKEAAGMRNILVHEYFDIDLNITWGVLKYHLPELKKAILSLVAK
ncbi:MAG: DUF86 domain-containing protein [Patescibacteria group bacterium]|nr:DUF86 domain-containing protein [Patescibacteria group bacterium]